MKISKEDIETLLKAWRVKCRVFIDNALPNIENDVVRKLLMQEMLINIDAMIQEMAAELALVNNDPTHKNSDLARIGNEHVDFLRGVKAELNGMLGGGAGAN